MTEIAQRITAGDIRALARTITKVENNDASAIAILKELYGQTGHARIIGLTGSPGAGKSSLINELASKYLERGLRVAVVAVDPTSEFTGGGVLGDRIRMPIHNANLYIRSFGNRGHLGGLNEACANTLILLDAAKYDRIILETVGTGQSEIEVKNYSDTVVVITTPNQGDDIQMMKAGILEIGDIFVVNKADLPDADRTVAELIKMTHLFMRSNTTEHDETNTVTHGETGNNEDSGRVPPVLKVSAREGSGVLELVDAIEDHYAYMSQYNLLSGRRQRNTEQALVSLLTKQWHKEVLSNLRQSEYWRDTCGQIINTNLDPWTGSAWLWDKLKQINERS